jgi:hypothetical protein
MHSLGLDFKAPKQSDVEQWAKVELLHRNGYDFGSCGCSGPGPRPERLRDVGPFLVEQERLRREAERTHRLAAAEEERRRKRKKSARARQEKRLARERQAST